MFAAKNELFTRPNGGYNLTRSLRFRSSASAYLNRTPASAGNRQIFTYSAWVKLGSIIGSSAYLISANTASGYNDGFGISFASGTLDLSATSGGSTVCDLNTTQVFRDPSAWYHVLYSVDTPQATASNRIKLYINGSQVTSFSTATYPSQNASLQMNNAVATYIGRLGYTSSVMFDGYMTEINLVDGQALTPSSFGAFSIYNQWLPKKYAGTYGTNGFYLPFTNNASAVTLGNDFSGNGNTWTTNNISVTAGSTYDSMTDVPTLTSATAANFAVVNPLKKGGSATITDGNLTVAINSNGGEQPANIGISNGKWYWEVSPTGSTSALGLLPTSVVPSVSSFASGYHYYGGNGLFYTNLSAVTYGATYGNGDVIGVAVDLVNNQITFYKNNTSQGTQSIVAGEYFPDFGAAAALTNYVNFGQRPFNYSPPSGYVALNTFNL
jgi:hypothetical protein